MTMLGMSKTSVRDGSMGGKLKDVRDRNNFSIGRGVPLFTC